MNLKSTTLKETQPVNKGYILWFYLHEFLEKGKLQ